MGNYFPLTDSLLRDHESKKEIDSLANLCLGQLKTVQEKHGESVSNIRSEAEKCLIKDYLVGWLAQNADTIGVVIELQNI